MRRAHILIISISLIFAGNALADQERCRVERRYLAFFTPWGEEAPTPPNIAAGMLADMVQSVLTEALDAETGVVDMDHLIGASMKHTYHVHLWYAYRFVHNHKFKTPWVTGVKEHLADGVKDFFSPDVEGKKSAQSAVSTAKRDLLKKFEKEIKEECEKHN